jgi:NADH-quinone oxidoreductase subunit N
MTIITNPPFYSDHVTLLATLTKFVFPLLPIEYASTNFLIKNLTVHLPEVLFIILVLYSFAAVIVTRSKKDTKTYIYIYSDLGIIILLFFNVFYLIHLYYNFDFAALTFGGLFSINSFISVGKFFIAFLTLIYLFTTTPFFTQDNIFDYEFITLIFFSIIGMLLLVSSYDFLSMFLSLELQSFCLYALAGARINRVRSVEAGLKYFVLGSLASGILLLGCSLVYLFTGLSNFGDIKMVLSVTQDSDIIASIALGLLFISIGFLFKLGVAPFHNWLPDVYFGSPSSITLFIGTIPKLSVYFFFSLFCSNFFSIINVQWNFLLIYIGLFSILVGTFGALAQKKLKQLIAYSSIAHLGYLILGIGGGTLETLQAGLVYVIIYILLVFGLFLSILLLRDTPKVKVIRELEDINILNSLTEGQKPYKYFIALILLSMAGIPPLLGFFSKFLIIKTLLFNGFFLLSLLVVIISVVSCFYYLRIIKNMFFTKTKQLVHLNEFPLNTSTILIIISLLNLMSPWTFDFFYKLTTSVIITTL